MDILYTYNNLLDDGDDIGAARVFSDAKGGREERTALLCGGGLRKGDRLFLRALSDLGHGPEKDLMASKVSDIGAEIVIEPLAKVSKTPAVHWRPDEDCARRCLDLWYSARPTKRVLERIADIAGRPVSRGQMYTLGGPRDGSSKPDWYQKEQS
jgi:hypothetical protein